jgi:hypothetical protein
MKARLDIFLAMFSAGLISGSSVILVTSDWQHSGGYFFFYTQISVACQTNWKKVRLVALQPLCYESGTEEPFRPLFQTHIIALGGSAMPRDLVRDGLRFKLAQRYQENPTHFLSLSKQAIDSPMAREILAELRNAGHVEEDVRGTIRLTPRGYRAFQNDPPPYSYEN